MRDAMASLSYNYPATALRTGVSQLSSTIRQHASRSGSDDAQAHLCMVILFTHHVLCGMLAQHCV